MAAMIGALLASSCVDPAADCEGEYVSGTCIPASGACGAVFPTALDLSAGTVCAREGADLGDVVARLCRDRPDLCNASLAACPGGPPASLDECDSVAWTHADCGGEGGPVYGCDPAGCRWFTGGCAPVGTTVSDCPSNAICCADDWPFEETPYDHPTSHFLVAYGLKPWDRETALDVAVVRSTEGHGTHALECSDSLARRGDHPCGAALVVELATDAEGAIHGALVSPDRLLYGWRLLVETSGDLARVCIAPATDFHDYTCSHLFGPGHDCAVSGTVSLSTDGGSVDVEFADGAWVRGTF